MFRKTFLLSIVLILLLASVAPAASAAPAKKDYLVSANAPLTAAQVDQLRAAGATITFMYKNFGGAALKLSPEEVVKVRALPFVTSVDEDADEELVSVMAEPATGLALPGKPFWLDLINAENNTEFTGKDVWVAVLDAGFFPNWRDYFDESSILTDYATAFIGNDGKAKDNQWDVGTSAHGMAVSGIIIGYRLVDKPKEGGFGDAGPLSYDGYLTGEAGTYQVPGVAPAAKIIPVRVCDPLYCKTSRVLAAQDYIIDLKNSFKNAGIDQPIVINESFGNRIFTQLKKNALDAVIKSGVIMVAAAGNGRDRGMIFPAAYEPVISAGGGGWIGQWKVYRDKTWWWQDVPENGVNEVYVADFSSRKFEGQYLDVVSTASEMLVPFSCPSLSSINMGVCSGKASPDSDQSTPFQYIFGSGTSFSSPTVVGIVALMLEKNKSLNNPALDNSDAPIGVLEDPTSWKPGSLELLLESGATKIEPGSVRIRSSDGSYYKPCWETGDPGCVLPATGHGWIFVDDALAAVP
jgi:subtilisin family serine protease